MSKRRLGKGLGALIPELEVESGENIVELDVDKIKPNRHQPRRDFAEQELKELAASIREHGVLQPIIVRQMGLQYELVAGERRWRASKMAGLKTIPGVVRDLDDARVMEITLIENIQRKNLGPLEEATAYRRLMDSLGLTQEEVAERVKKSRSQVANVMRLLLLPAEVQDMIKDKRLTAGHARALLGLSNAEAQINTAKKAVKNELSVREIEQLVREKQNVSRETRRTESKRDPFLADLEERLHDALSAKVKITAGKRGGNIQIRYQNSEDLKRITEFLFHES